MTNKWVQIIGTLLIGGVLINWIIPLFISVFGSIAKPDEINILCISLGGKIHRKWYLINNLIYFITLPVLLLILFLFKNVIMFLIIIPYLFLLIVLYWGNVYKRMNAISNYHIFSICFTCILAFLSISSGAISKVFPKLQSILHICILIVLFVLFVIPSRKTLNKE